MNNVIITEPSRNLRMLGRQALAGNWKTAIVAALIFDICVSLPALILDQLFGKTLAELYENLYYNTPGSFGSTFIYGMSENAEKISTMSGLYVFLVTGAFTLGLTIFFINLFRRKEADPAQVFSGFEQFFKALGLCFMIGLFTALWTLLFIVPGIVAAIRYSQAFFILADNPEKGIMECIRESKQMMKGNKGKFFCLELSFLGWGILTATAIGVASGIFAAIFGSGIIMVIFNWIFGLATCWLVAYTMSTEAAFYEILKGNLKADTYTPGEF